MIKKLLLLLTILSFNFIVSQTTITGTVYDIYLESLIGAKVSFENTVIVTDDDGFFELKTNKNLPLSITISLTGYSTRTLEITTTEEISIVLEKELSLQEIVISASRVPERIIESPVSVERLNLKNIKNSSSANFYEGLVALKGIDVLSNSFSVKNVVSNRGFANTENVRFVQLVDGIETTLPFINYSLGNNFGTSELDIASVEILPGAASALYGPNAVNGIMLMNTKSPFIHEGISTYIKTGFTEQKNGDAYGFYDLGLRMAKTFNSKIAAKANFTYNQGEDWHATDYRNTSGQGGTIIDGFSHNDTAAYNGLNVYGDDTNYNLVEIGQILLDQGETNANQVTRNLLNIDFTRIGYHETDLVDYKTKSVFFGGSLHYRPFGDKKFEIVAGAKYNLADNIIHGVNRYFQKGGLTQQYRLELNHDNFFIRGYYTQNKTNLIDPRLLGLYIVNSFKDEETYTKDFYDAYIVETNNLITEFGRDIIQQGTYTEANTTAARLAAEEGRPEVGSAEFNQLLTTAKNTNVSDGGALLKDQSGFINLDANYNFASLTNVVDTQIGGSFRSYQLNSNGNIYNDANRDISFDEYGLYTQFLKRFLDERMKITLTTRYDKSKNFEGNFSPRASVTYAMGEKKNHNIRFSYQTGFRNPTTRDQYADINIGRNRKIIGTVKDNLDEIADFYTANSNIGNNEIPDGITLTSQELLDNSYTFNSVENFKNAARDSILAGDPRNRGLIPTAATVNNPLLEKAEFDYVKPETVKTFELGYRSSIDLFNNVIELDMSTFYSIYNNFITQKAIIVPFYGDIDSEEDRDQVAAALAVLSLDTAEYIIRTNATSVVNSYGFNAGLTTKIFGDFNFGFNYAFSDFEVDGDEQDFKPAYNTPKHVVKLSLGNDHLFKNFGFKVDGRWQDEYLYQSLFIDDLIEDRVIVDAQLTYKVPSFKSSFKLGATNIGGNPYISVPGAGTVGSVYYINWTINN